MGVKTELVARYWKKILQTGGHCGGQNTGRVSEWRIGRVRVWAAIIRSIFDERWNFVDEKRSR